MKVSGGKFLADLLGEEVGQMLAMARGSVDIVEIKLKWRCLIQSAS